MSTVLWTMGAVLAFVAVLMAHEGAHALAARSFGVTIKHMGVGIKMWPYVEFAPTAGRPFTVSVSPWLVAAYVRIAAEDCEALEARDHYDRSWYLGAGVWINTVIGVLLLAGHDEFTSGRQMWGAIEALAVVALVVFRRGFCAYVIPAMQLPALVLFSWSLVSTVGQPQGAVSVGLLLVSHSVSHVVWLGAVLSFTLAIINMLPLMPMDGGRITGALMRGWWGEKKASRFEIVTTLMFALISVYSLLSDALLLR